MTPIIGEAFEARKEKFIKEVNAIGEKYKILIRPQLVYTRQGIVPDYTYIDTKEQPLKKETKS